MLALAAPSVAYSIAELSPSVEGQVAALSVSASLESCGVHETQVVCELQVGFEPLAEATGYSATVTRADGSVLDMGAIGAGGASLYVPYVGSGTYSVRVTAYGQPIEPADPSEDETTEEVIATDVGKATASGDQGTDVKDDRSTEAGAAGTVSSTAGPREDAVAESAEQTLNASPSCVEPAAEPAPEPEPLPEEPPEDLDPDNPDEDADEILDEDERIAYELAVAEREEAAASAVAAAPAC